MVYVSEKFESDTDHEDCSCAICTIRENIRESMTGYQEMAK